MAEAKKRGRPAKAKVAPKVEILMEDEVVIESEPVITELPKLEMGAIADKLNETSERLYDADVIGKDASEFEGDIDELNDQIRGAKEPGFIESIPYFGKMFDKSEFKQSSFEHKMQMLFSGYDKKTDALKESFDVMEEHQTTLKEFLDKYTKSVEGVDASLLSDDDVFEFTQRAKTITALETSINRLELMMSDTNKIWKGMVISKDRYVLEMQNAIFEIGASKRLNDGLGLWATFEEKATKTQTMLTTGVIDSNKKTNVTGRAVMSSDKLNTNASRLLSAAKSNGNIRMLGAGK